jgi:hypothetical protein
MKPIRDGYLAKHSGTCPVCGRYIVKGQSWIDALPVALPLTLEFIQYSPHRRCWHEAHGAGRLASPRSRQWAHADCVSKHLRATGGEDQGDIAKARRAALRRHREAACR